MKSSSKARSYSQCFMCRAWTWTVCKPAAGVIGVELCLPCYVDVLEVRQARGVMGVQDSGNDPAISEDRPGNSPSPFRQLDLFD